MKWYANREQSTQAHLHTFAADDPTRVVHFGHPRVLEMYRRLLAYFQKILLDLKISDFFSPLGLVMAIVFVRLPLSEIHHKANINI